MESKTNENNKTFLTQILILSSAILVTTLLGSAARYFANNKAELKSGHTLINQPTPIRQKTTTPTITIDIKEVNQSAIDISIQNTSKEDVDLRAFTLEVIVDKPLNGLVDNSIERVKELERGGLILPIRKVEIDNGKTFFKLAGVLIGKEMTIKENQELNLASINLKPYSVEEIRENLELGGETKIIDNSGNSLEFVVEKE